MLGANSIFDPDVVTGLTLNVLLLKHTHDAKHSPVDCSLAENRNNSYPWLEVSDDCGPHWTYYQGVT